MRYETKKSLFLLAFNEKGFFLSSVHFLMAMIIFVKVEKHLLTDFMQSVKPWVEELIEHYRLVTYVCI